MWLEAGEKFHGRGLAFAAVPRFRGSAFPVFRCAHQDRVVILDERVDWGDHLAAPLSGSGSSVPLLAWGRLQGNMTAQTGFVSRHRRKIVPIMLSAQGAGGSPVAGLHEREGVHPHFVAVR